MIRRLLLLSVLCFPWLAACAAEAFFAPAVPTGSIVVSLHPTEGIAAGSTRIVTFGVPFPRGSITAAQLSSVRVLRNGTEVAALTYEKGDRKLIIKAVRYPNIIFTSFMAMQQRMELQMKTAEFRGTEFATVRGLDVTEDLLPEGFRGRMFFADVGAQIHLRILAPKRMSDEDLVPFLETLHVKAMNAGVIDKVEGLGEVPVIVLASALDEAERDAYLADVAAREAEEATKAAAELAKAEAAQATETPAEDAASGGGFLSGLFGGGASDEAAADAPAEKSAKVGCTTGKDGVKRCTVESAAPTE